MKKYIFKATLLATLAFSSFACDDFLDQKPTTAWDSETFYKDAQEAELGLMGIYNYLAEDDTYGSSLMATFLAGNDEAHYSRDYSENWSVSLYTHTPATTDIEDTWSVLYEGVDAANKFIEGVPHIESLDSALKMSMLGEAHFLRAQFYFDLVRWWGKIPLRLASTTDITDNNFAASEISEVYESIVNDLKFACKYLETPETLEARNQTGRAHKMAAHGILARVYLTMAGEPLLDTEKYRDAVLHCDTVIKYGYNEMNTNYQTTFRNYITNSNDNKATLFDVSFQNLRNQGIQEHGKVGNLNGVQFTYGGEGYPYAYAYMQLSVMLKDVYEYGDERYMWNVADFKFDKKTKDIERITSEFKLWPGKFRRWEPADFTDLDTVRENEQYLILEPLASPDKNFTGINFPILRMSDVWLMRAEAEFQVYGPTPYVYTCINKVRHRAGLLDLDEGVVGEDQLMREIQDERFRELCFEGIRQHDLVRWGILKETLEELNDHIRASDEYNDSKAYLLRSGEYFNESKHLTLPYPLQEVTLNKLLDQKENW